MQACVAKEVPSDLCWSERWIVPTWDVNHRVGPADRREGNNRCPSNVRKKYDFTPRRLPPETKVGIKLGHRYEVTPTIFCTNTGLCETFPGKRNTLARVCAFLSLVRERVVRTCGVKYYVSGTQTRVGRTDQMLFECLG